MNKYEELITKDVDIAKKLSEWTMWTYRTNCEGADRYYLDGLTHRQCRIVEDALKLYVKENQK
jgi:hypothetical protein